MPFKNGIPDGMHSLNLHLAVRGAAQALEFYKKAFGGVELTRAPMPGTDKLMHAAIRIGDSVMLLNDEFPEHGSKAPPTVGGSPVVIQLCVPDCDATVKTAVAAGAKVTMPPMDMFWGDRYAQLEDPFGHKWAVSTRVRDVSPEEAAKAGAEAMAKMKK
jgi:PhnB protein